MLWCGGDGSGWWCVVVQLYVSSPTPNTTHDNSARATHCWDTSTRVSDAWHTISDPYKRTCSRTYPIDAHMYTLTKEHSHARTNAHAYNVSLRNLDLYFFLFVIVVLHFLYIYSLLGNVCHMSTVLPGAHRIFERLAPSLPSPFTLVYHTYNQLTPPPHHPPTATCLTVVRHLCFEQFVKRVNNFTCVRGCWLQRRNLYFYRCCCSIFYVISFN